MEKKRKRASFLKLLNDCLMVIFSMGAMAGRYLENPVHETMGLFFVLAVAIHGFQHLNWFKTMLLGRYGWRRILPFGIVFSLLFTAIILLAHGVMMSRTWFSFMEIKSTFTTYWNSLDKGQRTAEKTDPVSPGIYVDPIFFEES